MERRGAKGIEADMGTGSTGAADARVAGQQFLAFCIGREEYGVHLHKVQELRPYESVTAIANAPSFFKGVINLRGAIVPILDMRIRFGSTATYDAFTVVVILSLGETVIGMVVDSVSDVVLLQADQVKPPPSFGNTVATAHLIGMGALEGRMLTLIDIDALLADSEIGLGPLASRLAA